MVFRQLVTATRLQSLVDANVKLPVAFEPEFEVMIPRKLFLRRDRGEFNYLRLRENVLGDFVCIRPFRFGRGVRSGVFVFVAAAFFFVRPGGLTRAAFLAGLGCVFFCRSLRGRLFFFRRLGLFLFVFRKQIKMERLGQLRRRDVAARLNVEDLLGLTLFVANDAAVDRLDLERGRFRRDLGLCLDRVAQLSATLCRAESLSQLQFHPILLGRKNDRGTAHERLAVVQPKGDGVMWRGIVRRENIRAAEHVESEELFEPAGLHGVGQLDGRQNALHARLLCVFGKRHVLQLRAE